LGSFRKKISTKFKNRYRLILRQDENLEEKVSIVLTPWNLLIGLCGGLFLFGTIIYLLLAYTPLNYIFPVKSAKYSSQEQFEMVNKIDSLELSLSQLRLQSEVLGKVLAGEDVSINLPEELLEDKLEETETNVDIQEPEAQVALRPIETSHTDYNFYVPLSGVISDTFNIDNKHRAVDIAAESRSVIKSIQKGTVIFSAWTSGGGHTLIIQHPNQ